MIEDKINALLTHKQELEQRLCAVQQELDSCGVPPDFTPNDSFQKKLQDALFQESRIGNHKIVWFRKIPGSEGVLRIFYNPNNDQWKVLADCQNKVNFDGVGNSYNEALNDFGFKISLEADSVKERNKWLDCVFQNWNDLFNLGQ